MGRNNAQGTTAPKGKQKKILIFSFIGLVLAFLLFGITPAGEKVIQDVSRFLGYEVLGKDAQAAPVRIHFIDVGKADAILLECEGEAALLDAGTELSGKRVHNYLTRLGIDSLNAFIATHPDKDHIGGFPFMLEKISPQRFVRPEISETWLENKSYLALEDALQREQVEVQAVKPGDTLYLGGAQLEILGPVQRYAESNNSSLVFRMTYKNVSALFCGDIEGEAEKDLLKTGENLSAQLLKVPHHGSHTSCTERFLRAVSPQFAVICVGSDNSNLPKGKVLTNLYEQNVSVYRTDMDGNVVFYTFGNEFCVQTEKE